MTTTTVPYRVGLTLWATENGIRTKMDVLIAIAKGTVNLAEGDSLLRGIAERAKPLAQRRAENTQREKQRGRSWPYNDARSFSPVR